MRVICVLWSGGASQRLESPGEPRIHAAGCSLRWARSFPNAKLLREKMGFMKQTRPSSLALCCPAGPRFCSHPRTVPSSDGSACSPVIYLLSHLPGKGESFHTWPPSLTRTRLQRGIRLPFPPHQLFREPWEPRFGVPLNRVKCSEKPRDSSMSLQCPRVQPRGYGAAATATKRTPPPYRSRWWGLRRPWRQRLLWQRFRRSLRQKWEKRKKNSWIKSL